MSYKWYGMECFGGPKDGGRFEMPNEEAEAIIRRALHTGANVGYGSDNHPDGIYVIDKATETVDEGLVFGLRWRARSTDETMGNLDVA